MVVASLNPFEHDIEHYLSPLLIIALSLKEAVEGLLLSSISQKRCNSF